MTEKKTTVPKAAPEHRDILGRIINVGDFVAVSVHNDMKIARVTKLNPKMVKVLRLPNARYDQNKYPNDVVRLEASDMTWFMLKNAS